MSKLSLSQRTKLLNNQFGRCFYCGDKVQINRCEVDHILPFSKYRNGQIYNMCIACCECNRIKSDRTLNELKTIFEKNFSHKLIRGMFFFEFLGLTSEDILLTKHSERDGITFY